MFYLCRRGYGSVAELETYDTPRLLDLIEYDQIQQDLEQHHYEEARNGGTSR